MRIDGLPAGVAPGVVRPQQPHEVAPIGALRMYGEFSSNRAAQGAPHTSQVL